MSDTVTWHCPYCSHALHFKGAVEVARTIITGHRHQLRCTKRIFGFPIGMSMDEIASWRNMRATVTKVQR